MKGEGSCVVAAVDVGDVGDVVAARRRSTSPYLRTSDSEGEVEEVGPTWTQFRLNGHRDARVTHSYLTPMRDGGRPSTVRLMRLAPAAVAFASASASSLAPATSAATARSDAFLVRRASARFSLNCGASCCCCSRSSGWICHSGVGPSSSRGVPPPASLRDSYAEKRIIYIAQI